MSFPFKSFLGILLLFPQHRVLFYFCKNFMFFVAMWLLYNYYTTPLSLSYHLDTLCHISDHVVRSLPPSFLKRVHKLLFDLLSSSCINMVSIWSCPVAFPFLSWLVAISISTSFGGSTYGSAVCTHIVHSSSLSLSFPSCSSKWFL